MNQIIITIDGIDGCGKETTAKNLAHKLKTKEMMKVKLLSFPMYNSKNSILIRDFLDGNIDPDKNLDPYTKAMLFALERRIFICTNLDKLKEYDVIIMDRSFVSNLIYQLADLTRNKKYEYVKKDDFLMSLLDMEFNYINNILFVNPFSLFNKYAFHYIIYHESFQTNMNLLSKRKSDDNHSDINESDTNYLKMCYDSQFHVFNFLSNKKNLLNHGIQNASYHINMLKISDKNGIIKNPDEIVSEISNSIYNNLT